MSTFQRAFMFLAVVGLITSAAVQAQAGYIFYEDWESYDASPFTGTNYGSGQGAGGLSGGGVILNGQQGWVRVPGWTASQQTGNPRVFTNGPGGSGKMLHEYNDNANWNKSAQKSLYGDNSYRTFTAADTAIELRMRVFTSNATASYTDQQFVGLVWDGFLPELGKGYLGVTKSGSNPTITFAPFGGTTTVTGDALLKQHWYDVKGVMNFAPIASGLSPTISFFYRDLGTTIEAEDEALPWVADATLTANQAMWEGALPSVYQANKLYIRQIRSYYDSAIDIVSLSEGAIPEPSTLALLAAGLVGLLAYAWRKRKKNEF